MEELRKTTTKSPLPLYPVEDISQYARSVPQRYGNPGDMMVFVPINVKRIKLLEIFPKAKIIERLINLDKDSCAFEVTFYENISDDEQHFRQNCIGYSTRNIADNFVEAARTAAYRNLFRALGVTTIAEALNDISEDSEFMEPLGYEGKATVDGITVDGTSTVGLDALEKKLLASYEKKKAESEPKPKPEAYPSPLPVAKAASDAFPSSHEVSAGNEMPTSATSEMSVGKPDSGKPVEPVQQEFARGKAEAAVVDAGGSLCFTTGDAELDKALNMVASVGKEEGTIGELLRNDIQLMTYVLMKKDTSSPQKERILQAFTVVSEKLKKDPSLYEKFIAQ